MKGFRSDYVPPEEFSHCAWFEPLRPGVRWFYHRARGGPRTVQPAVLDETLDSDLRPVVAAVRRLGLETLPSCAGHSVDVFYVLRLYEQLCRDAVDVRGLGLPLRDVETGEEVFWQDPEYQVPWRSSEELEAELRAHEREGALGLVGRRPVLAAVACRLLSVPHVRLSEESGALWLRVHAPSQGWQQRAWCAIAERLDV